MPELVTKCEPHSKYVGRVSITECDRPVVAVIEYGVVGGIGVCRRHLGTTVEWCNEYGSYVRVWDPVRWSERRV